MAKPFNDTAGGTGIIQLIEQNIFGDTGYGQISGNVQRLQQITNWVNEGRNRYTLIALQSDGKWQVDDSNYSDYPFATTDLIANQQDYQFLVSMVDILSVEVLNSGKVWYTLSEVDEQEMANDHVSMTQRFIVPSQPWVFNRTANSIFLLPAPNYNMRLIQEGASGLKVKYQRPPNYYIYSDTSKTSGFAELLDEYVADYATWKYMMPKQIGAKVDFKTNVDNYEQVLIPGLYLKREKDTTKRLYPRFKRVR